MKHARTLLQTLIPLVLVLSLVLPLWVGQASLASEVSSGCSVTRSHTTSASERYNVPATCFADAGWAIPVPASADGNLETSTNYDYDSPIYLSNHGFRHGGVDWVGPLHSPYDTSTPVRAIGDGTIRHVVRDDDPTTNNSRLHIEHTAGNGAKFLAIYGHTYALSSFSVGGTVYHGQQIGTLRQYGSPIHLHFELNTILTTTSYGGVKDGTVDPLQFLIDNPGSGSTIDLALVSCYSQKFPFIYLTVRASSNGQPVSDLTKADFSVTEDGRLQTDMFDVVPPQEGGGVRMADIVFLIDTSGSMGGKIAAVRDNCVAFADALVASDVDYRLGLVQFGQSGGGHPRIIGGGLTASASEFQSWVATLYASGGYEPGFAAIRLAIQSYSFRPGSQKVFILITDEDSDCRDKQTTIDMILANDVTVHVAADCSFGTSQSDYCGPGSVRDVSGGLLFPVMGDYRSILDTIGEAVANTYIVRYRTDNPALDGTVRTVVCTAQKGTASDFVQCTYIAGGAPHIQRTEETLALHNQSLVEGSSPTISVLVTDAAEPFVQSVTLFVRTAGSGKAYGQIAMLPQGNDIYSADVPGSYVQSPGLDYYIRATDGQSTSWDPSTDPDKKPYQIAVLPNESPVIEHTPPASWQTGNDVSLGISAYDSTYGIASLNVYYRKQGDLLWQAIVSEYDPPPYAIGKTVVLPVAGWNTAAIEYYIQATDDLGVSSYWPLGGADDPHVLSAAAPLEITDVQAGKIAMTSATITWATNQPSTSEVNYGTTAPPDLTSSSPELVSNHELTLTGLEPGTTYLFQVKSTTQTGSTVTDDNGGRYHSFSTPDKLLPVPYMYQGATNWCYLYSLSMVLQYYGYNAHPYQIANDWDLGRDEGAGTLLAVLTEYTKKYVEKTLKLELDVTYDLGGALFFNVYKNHIDRNVPVIVVDTLATNHAGVVVGYETGPSDDDRYLYIHDPSGAWVASDGLGWNPDASGPLMYVKVPMKTFRNALLLSTAYLVIIEGVPNYPSGVMYLGDFDAPNEGRVYHAAEDSSVKDVNRGELYLNDHLDWVWGAHLGGGQEILSGSEYLHVSAIITNQMEGDTSYEFRIRVEDGRSRVVYSSGLAVEVTRLSKSPVSIRIPSSDLSLIEPGEYDLHLELHGTGGHLCDRIGPIPVKIASTGAANRGFKIQIPNRFIGGDVSFYVNMYAYSHQYDNGKWYWTFYADAYTRIGSESSDPHLDSSLQFQLIGYDDQGRQIYRSGWLSTDTNGDGVYGDCGPLGGHTPFVRSNQYGSRRTDSVVFKTIWRDKYQRWWLTSDEIECLTLQLA